MKLDVILLKTEVNLKEANMQKKFTKTLQLNTLPNMVSSLLLQY